MVQQQLSIFKTKLMKVKLKIVMDKLLAGLHFNLEL